MSSRVNPDLYWIEWVTKALRSLRSLRLQLMVTVTVMLVLLGTGEGRGTKVSVLPSRVAGKYIPPGMSLVRTSDVRVLPKPSDTNNGY